ncbi:MAG: ATP-binding protein [Candidatus Dojkabacteria bacterium]|nr:MAG: ATP-binding protein [Candidatus Dojkabacteria bacterium]
MNPIKYFFKQSKYALNDFNQRIDSKGREYIKDSIRKAEIAKLSPDDSLVFEFQNKGKLIEIDDRNIQSYMISEFPQVIYPNWLYDLVNYGEPIVISQFIKPLDSQKALSGLRNRITNLSAQFYEKADKGKMHTIDLEQAIADARSIEDSIVRGVEKLYSMSMYLKLSQENTSKLIKSDKALKDLSYAKQIKLHQLVYKQKQGLETFLPNVTNAVGEEFYLTSSNVSSSLPFTTATLNDPDGIFYGITLGGEKIRFDRFSKASKNYNGIIFATSGAGKSFSAKLEAYRSLFRGINVYVIDPEGEFKTLCDYVGGTNIDINPESKTKVNPLQFFSSDTDTKEVMRTHLGVVKGLLKIWLSEDAYNRGIVSKAVNETYASKGILLDDPSTYSKKPPTISDLIKIFEKQGEEGKRIAVELLEYSHKGEMGDLYDNPSTDDVDFNSPMVVFNIQKVPDQEKQASIFYLSNFIWQKVLSNRNRKVLIIDEAHLLLKDESSANFMENLVRRGRKYNLGVISISQDVDDFLKSPQGSVIAKNADTALILAQKKQSIPSLVKAFDLSDVERDYITRLTKGQALFIKGNTHSHMFVYATPHERKLFSSNAEDLAKIDEQRKNGQ